MSTHDATGRHGEAPAKIILLGEHAVVYGHPAFAMPVPERRARADIEPNSSGEVRLEVSGPGSSAADSPRLGPFVELVNQTLAAFGADEKGFTIRISSTIPVGCGMGSSAAVAVALVRAVAATLHRDVSMEEVMRLAMISEKDFHGNPSGVDVEVITRGEPILFSKRKGAETVLPAKSAFHFVIANSGVPSSTADVVRDVALAHEGDRAHYDSLFWEMGMLASAAPVVIRKGAPAHLGPFLVRAHNLLQAINVSCAELDELVEAALGAGAVGAKLTGAGRGGNVVALLASADDEDGVRDALLAAGAVDTCVTSLEPVAAGVRQ